jgi:hypothetical protein
MSDEPSFMLFPISGRVYVWRTPKETYSPECAGVSVIIWAAILWYSIGTIITLHGRITTRDYVYNLGNQVYPMIQKSFSDNSALFQHDSTPVHRSGTVQLWFKEHEGELQHIPYPAHSPDMIIIEPFWSVLETRIRNRLLPPISVKQFEDVLPEEWHKISLKTVQNLYKSIQVRITAVLKAKGGQTPY